MVVILIISVIINIILIVKIIKDRNVYEELEEEIDKIRDEKDGIEQEAEDFYKKGNERIKQLKVDNESLSNELDKKVIELSDTSRALEVSISERKKLEIDRELLNKKILELIAKQR